MDDPLYDLAALEGLISEDVGRQLAALAERVPAGQTIVEVGSFKGKSTAYLASGACRSGALVHAVDPWDSPGNATGRFGFASPSTRAAFERQLETVRMRGVVIAHQGFSNTVAAGWQGPPIGLLYIDGSHLEADVDLDFISWRPHLAPGAIVAWDDYDTPRNPGVKRAVDRLVKHYGGTLQHGPAPLVWWIYR